MVDSADQLQKEEFKFKNLILYYFIPNFNHFAIQEKETINQKFSIVPQLSKCLKFEAVRRGGLN